MILTITAIISILLLALTLQIYRAKRSIYHIHNKTYLRTDSFIQSMMAIRKPMSEVMTKGVDETIELSRANDEKFFVSWLLFWPVLSITDSAIVATVQRRTDLFPKYIPSQPGPSTEFVGKENLGFVEGEEWAHQRSLLNGSFTKTSELFGAVHGVVNDFLEIVERDEEKWESGARIGELLQLFTLDSLGNAILGYDFKLLHGNTDTPLQAYNAVVENTTNLSLMIPVISQFLPAYKKVVKNAEIFSSFVDDLIHEKVEFDKNSILGRVITDYNSGAMTYEAVRSNIIAFFLAGHETTSNASRVELALLGLHPEIQQKCRDAIFSAIEEEGEYNYQALKKMKYLDWFIDEALRLYSPVPLIDPRITADDVTLEDYFIPKGTLIFNYLKSGLTDPNIWEDAYTFKPERFEKLTKEQKTANIPFSIGPRVCIGKSFSLLEQKMLIVSLLRRYTIGLTDQSQFELSATFLVGVNDEKLFFTFNKL